MLPRCCFNKAVAGKKAMIALQSSVENEERISLAF